jgi:hypothetical protein
MIAPAIVDGTSSEYTLVAWYLGKLRETDGGCNKLSRADEFLLADSPEDNVICLVYLLLLFILRIRRIPI